jgi:hypothetical protein
VPLLAGGDLEVALDFLPEMLQRTTEAAAEAGLRNVETLEGEMAAGRGSSGVRKAWARTAMNRTSPTWTTRASSHSTLPSG